MTFFHPTADLQAKTLARELEPAIGQNTETLDTRRLRVFGRDVGSAMARFVWSMENHNFLYYI